MTPPGRWVVVALPSSTAARFPAYSRPFLARQPKHLWVGKIHPGGRIGTLGVPIAEARRTTGSEQPIEVQNNIGA
jgi:hypothetical protein